VKPKPIGVVGALHWELVDLLRHVQVQRRLTVGAQRLWEGQCHGRPVVVAETGVGRLRAERAVTVLLDRFALSALVCVGFGGGTGEMCRAGDIVLCPSVSSAHQGPGLAEWTRGASVRSDDGLIARAADVLRREGIRFHVGDGLTVARLIDDPGTKERLGKTLQAEVVDMEGYWVARQARERVGRLLLTRAISDPIGQPLPGLIQSLVGPEEVEHRQMALQVLTHPLQAAAILRLAHNACLAARNLGAFVSAFVDGL
jgi:nucleoside phosphorylase